MQNTLKMTLRNNAVRESTVFGHLPFSSIELCEHQKNVEASPQKSPAPPTHRALRGVETGISVLF